MLSVYAVIVLGVLGAIAGIVVAILQAAGSGGGTSCRCPGRNGDTSVCNCPFDDDCNPTECYNPGGGHIPRGCRMGCGG